MKTGSALSAARTGLDDNVSNPEKFPPGFLPLGGVG